MTYEFRLAIASIRRSKLLSAMIVCAIGLGIGVFMILLTAWHLLERDPLPQKSDRVFRVMIDSWGPNDEYGGGTWRAGEPPHLMTYQDAMHLIDSDIPVHQAAMFQANMYAVTPQARSDGGRPFQVRTRVTFRGFFPMFDVPFLYGGPWDKADDDGPNPVVVISRATNERLFGGENSVGRTVLLDDNPFRVVGVLDDWAPMPLFYNILSLGVGVSPPEDVFIPFHFLERYRLNNYGADMSWKAFDPGFENMLASESVWLQYWVQLDTPAQRAAYLDYLDNYAISQRQQGRFERPLNNRLYNVTEFIKSVTFPLAGPSMAFLVLGLLYLFVCIVNLVSMLLGKFTGRMREISIRRALGATRGSIFGQHLIEVCILGLAGGLLGILVSQGVLTAIRVRFNLADNLFSLDLYLLVVALLLSLVAGILAGLLPAFRASMSAPVTYLKAE